MQIPLTMYDGDGTVPSFNFRSTEYPHVVYVWYPGKAKPSPVRCSRGLPVAVCESPARKLFRVWTETEPARCTAYALLGIFGASAAYAVFFQYLPDAASDPATSVDLGAAFFAFLCAAILSLVAQVRGPIAGTRLELRLGRPGLLTLIAPVLGAFAFCGLALGVVWMSAAILRHMCPPPCKVNTVIEIWTPIMVLAASVLLAFIVVILLCPGFTRQVITGECDPSRPHVKSTPHSSEWGQDHYGFGLWHGQSIQVSTPMHMPSMMAFPVSISLPHPDVRSATFFLIAYDLYGGALQCLLKQPIPFFALDQGLQTRLLMQMYKSCCPPGAWEVFGTTDTADECCRHFLLLAARWLPVVDVLERSCMEQFDTMPMVNRVLSLLRLEKVLSVGLDAQTTDNASATPTGTGFPAQSNSPVDEVPNEEAASCSLCPPAEGRSHGETSAPQAQVGDESHVALDIIPALATTYPPAQIGHHAVKQRQVHFSDSSDVHRPYCVYPPARRVASGSLRRDGGGWVPPTIVLPPLPPDTGTVSTDSQSGIRPDGASMENNARAFALHSQDSGAVGATATGHLSTNTSNVSGVTHLSLCTDEDSFPGGVEARDADLASASVEPIRSELSPASCAVNGTSELCGTTCGHNDNSEPRRDVAITETTHCGASGSATSVEPGACAASPAPAGDVSAAFGGKGADKSVP